MEDYIEKALQFLMDNGACFADARFQRRIVNSILAENKELKRYEANSFSGVGIRVLYRGAWGYAATTKLSKEDILTAAKIALNISKNLSEKQLNEPFEISQEVINDNFSLKVRKKLEDISSEERIKLAVESNKLSFINKNIKNSRTIVADFSEERLIMNTLGTRVKIKIAMVGIGQSVVAKVNDRYEKIFEQKSRCSGFEFFDKINIENFIVELSKLVTDVLHARAAKAGTYPVVLDPKIVGLFAHEMVGHATEGDLILRKESILQNKLNMKIANENVTIIDDGLVDTGYIVPYDDEGTKKNRTFVIEKGILKRFLTSLETSIKLGMEKTGNGRAEGIFSAPLVRQTNYFLNSGDANFEEMIEDIDFGYYLLGRGAEGGEVNVTQGTFTFNTGPSYIIEKGEVKDLIKSTSISGNIIDTLKNIELIGKDLEVSTSIFGGCGKEGQLVKVGDGGPHVKVRQMIVGGIE